MHAVATAQSPIRVVQPWPIKPRTTRKALPNRTSTTGVGIAMTK
jgi:hypothetical protein